MKKPEPFLESFAGAAVLVALISALLTLPWFLT